VRLVARLRKRLAGARGYTLVELLTVMSILAVVMTGLTTLFVQGSNAEVDMNRRFQAQQDTRLALDRMRRDAHCASDVQIYWDGTLKSPITPAPTTPTAPTSGQTVGALLTFPSSTCVNGSSASGSNYIVSYCVVPITAGSRYKLVRDLTGSTTCAGAGAVIVADYLTSNTGSFSVNGAASKTYSALMRSANVDELTKLNIDFSINTKPTRPGAYRLTDGLVLRNSTKNSAASST
jgi:prepilin-type N-terminal cleavage/methylation domain-containing protein